MKILDEYLQYIHEQVLVKKFGPAAAKELKTLVDVVRRRQASLAKLRSMKQTPQVKEVIRQNLKQLRTLRKSISHINSIKKI